MNTKLTSFGLIFTLLTFGSSSRTTKVSTVTKLPENADQLFKSSLGIQKLKQWYVDCQPQQKNTTVKDCNFCLGKTSFEDKSTTWNTHQFQMKTRSKTSKIVIDYLKVFHFGEDIFVVVWIEYDTRSKRRVKHVNGVEIIVGMYIKFAVINFQNNSTSEGNTMGSPVIISPVDGRILFLQEFIDSIEIMTFEKKFQITYPYTSNFDLAQEIFRLNGHRSFGPVGAGDFRSEKHTHSMFMYSKNTKEIQSQEQLLHWQTGLCKEMYCDPQNFVNRKVSCGCSTANGRTTSCVPSRTEIWNCQQKDIKNDFGFRQFPIKIPPPSKTLMLYTMRNGDILTISGGESRFKSWRQKKLHGIGEIIHNVFKLKRFSRNGREHSKDITFAEFFFEISTAMGYAFDRDEETCFSLMWRNDTHFGSKSQCYDHDTFWMSSKKSRAHYVEAS
ncbi:hypothetical protein QAD02_009078 [Eretmocerus hayati]|uniref:Uncharacterized protein n=1 Tax=Eretmocerus hayati TaxID=131215 RepID=A0ACC2N8A1_9HYME|nr:hypothetical protein QAD02_009078 [Eretmocerus hayati]